MSPTAISACHRSRSNVSKRSPWLSPVESTGASMAALLTSTSTVTPSSPSLPTSSCNASGSVMSTCSWRIGIAASSSPVEESATSTLTTAAPAATSAFVQLPAQEPGAAGDERRPTVEPGPVGGHGPSVSSSASSQARCSSAVIDGIVTAGRLHRDEAVELDVVQRREHRSERHHPGSVADVRPGVVLVLGVHVDDPRTQQPELGRRGESERRRVADVVAQPDRVGVDKVEEAHAVRRGDVELERDGRSRS